MKFNYESELYPIVKDYLETEGYAVKSEVKASDVMAVAGDVTLIVELKLSFNLKLVFQALDRLEVCRNVFIAIPDYAFNARTKRKRDIVKLMRALGIGIMIIGKRPSGATIEIASNIKLVGEAADAGLLEEFHSRRYDLNSGGMVKAKIVTAFREQSIAVAAFLKVKGVMKAAEIKRQTGLDSATNILQRNYDGWFERVKRGHYQLSDKFYEDIPKYQQLYDYYLEQYRDKMD